MDDDVDRHGGARDGASRDGDDRQPTDDEHDRRDATDGSRDHPEPADDSAATETDRRLERELEAIRADLESLQSDVEERTVSRDEVESDLRQYVRKRVRRGKARGWGPYLVLLYGTAMTLGAFYFLSGGWAILAMVVIWLSTLGLYTLMVLTGLVFEVLGLPGRALDLVRNFRS